MNEELQTVNVELNARNEHLTELNSDLANFIDSTAIATLFLDSELRVRRPLTEAGSAVCWWWKTRRLPRS